MSTFGGRAFGPGSGATGLAQGGTPQGDCGDGALAAWVGDNRRKNATALAALTAQPLKGTHEA